MPAADNGEAGFLKCIRSFPHSGRAIYGEYSDRVEAFGLDENWIDLSGSTETIEDARRLAETIRTANF
jgi:DNA polymerase-4